jgi:hypothetical protein
MITQRVHSLNGEYKVFQDYSGTSGLKIIDTATPFLKLIAAENPKYIKWALQSTGWWLTKAIKYEIKMGTPGGEKYADFSKIKNQRDTYYTVTLTRKSKKTGRLKEIRRRFDTNQLVKETGTHKPMGRLANAVGYKYYSDSMRMLVGWLSQSAVDVGTKQELGYTRKITPKMRRLFRYSGIPLGKKSEITIPARPTFGPIYREKAPQIITHVERKIWDYIENGGKKV